jgi:signal transduction histidine kinase
VATACAFGLSLAAVPLLTLPGLLCASYAVAAYARPRTRVAAGVVAIAALVAAFGAAFLAPETRLSSPLHVALFGFGLAWLAGDRARTRRAYIAGLQERAARLERERDEQTRLAAEEERARIARELHDVVAHNVSLIAVQAGAARTTGARHPERAGEALSLIEGTARTTLSELRDLLGVLRRDDVRGAQKPPLRPQPSLAQMDVLLAQARAAGLQVTARVQGRVRELPAMTDLCAYRVLQESLTNAVKHAPGSHVRLLLSWRAQALAIVVSDDGPGSPDHAAARATARAAGAEPAASVAPDGPGHGLAGMRERVALAGGELQAGPARGGGFRVQARLPLGGARGSDASGAGGVAGAASDAAASDAIGDPASGATAPVDERSA